MGSSASSLADEGQRRRFKLRRPGRSSRSQTSSMQRRLSEDVPETSPEFVSFSDFDEDLRTYHSDTNSPYVLPDDVMEGNRLNMQHHLARMVYNGNNYQFVPKEALERGMKILDVGCGTAIWLSEMYRDFPRGEYHGVDITTTAWSDVFLRLGAQITLIRANVLERLPYPDNTFDYVHQQALIAGIPSNLWPQVIAELVRVLKPGGYLDLCEADPLPLMAPTPRAERFHEMIETMFKARNLDFRKAYELRAMVGQNPDLTSIRALRRTVPIGWDSKIGDVLRHDFRIAYGSSLRSFVTTATGLSPEEWERLVEGVLDDYAAGQSFINAFRVGARKIVPDPE
ncbi:S-adenosyl-L-methionine-dependent methyltransferase [Cladochytrium replicatum]|nr:S-adenosyl-L-methionine-dependent methyltransferase [Cladochytrium replicatum]